MELWEVEQMLQGERAARLRRMGNGGLQTTKVLPAQTGPGALDLR